MLQWNNTFSYLKNAKLFASSWSTRGQNGMGAREGELNCDVECWICICDWINKRQTQELHSSLRWFFFRVIQVSNWFSFPLPTRSSALLSLALVFSCRNHDDNVEMSEQRKESSKWNLKWTNLNTRERRSRSWQHSIVFFFVCFEFSRVSAVGRGRTYASRIISEACFYFK